MGIEDTQEIRQKAEEFLGLFRRGASFTKELLQENERLRRQLTAIEDRQSIAAQSDDEWGKLRQELQTRIQGLEAEKRDVLEQLEVAEAENRVFAGRYIEVEQENDNLASLYISSYQLHSTLDLSEVLKIILEIVINLIGAEKFAVYIADEDARLLQPVASEGARLETFPTVQAGSGPVGMAVDSGEIALDETADSRGSAQPIVCIPLRVEHRAIGAIAIYELLQQKDAFTPLDHELFTLLGCHAATAILAAQLYGHSERKLNTIQGFIDLLTK